MKVLLFGATGMIGSGTLIECLDDPRVEAVRAVGRRPCGVTHPKLSEVIHSDMFDLSEVRDELAGFDACFFCLGVSAAGMSEKAYSRITYDLTRSVADELIALGSTPVFNYISAAGAYTSEQGMMMWARVKGRIENYLFGLPFEAAYMFRPGYIQPMKGVSSRTKLYNALYAVAKPFYPVLQSVAPAFVTTTEKVGLAMVECAIHGSDVVILENRDINRLAERERERG